LARWATELNDPNQSRCAVLFYLDALVSYKTSYGEDEKECILWLEKIIENITPNHRLVLVALQDTMVPTQLYTHSPKCRVLPIPTPDKADRERYLRHRLGEHEHVGLMADLTDGLYLRELDHIIGEVQGKENLGSREIRRTVNRYRIGEQEDYWGSLSIEKLDGAFHWFAQTEGVKGQDEAVRKVTEVLCLARAGLSGMASGTTAKPKGVLFFAGPTGVGKTFLAKKLAKFLFGTEEAFIRFDMSEFKEEHTVSKLIGSPPGYVGYERGGMLTNSVRERPFSVVLFDEIEKAHPKIMDIYLQLLDEGRLTDSRGQTIFFTETVLVFTSNLGCRTTDSRGNPIAERQALDTILQNTQWGEEEKRQRIREHFLRSVEQFFLFEISRPELLNRIGSNIVPFNYIQSPAVQREIVGSHLRRIQDDFEDKYRQAGYRLTVEEGAMEYLVNKHGEQMAQFGGRGITNAIEAEIIMALARSVLRAEYEQRRNATFQVTLQEGRLKVNVA
jgi:ATP-dependent Clp protease ATP-binding subunit ClpA